MATQTQNTSVVMADAVIAQVIQLKDPDEAIPSAIWWRVAELVRACTTATASGPHLTATLVEHAFTATDDVLSSLSADIEPGPRTRACGTRHRAVRSRHSRRLMPHSLSAPVTTLSRQPGAAACG